MTDSMTRRAFVARTSTAVLAAAGALRLQAQAPATELEMTHLEQGLVLLRGAGAHVTALATSEGLVLVDSGLPESATALLAGLAKRWPGRAVHTVFNTNWRPEHTGGNEQLIAGGAEVLAHENTRLWMGAEFEIDWSGQTHLRQAPATWPTRTFYKGDTLELADAQLRYGHLRRAHTDGDVYVHFVEHDVLSVSDLLAVDGYPVVDYVTGGWIGGMVEATKALLALAGPDTRIVAASGSVQKRAALEAQLALCERVFKAVADCYRSGGSLEDFIASQPAADFEAERGNPQEFLTLVYESAWGHVRSLGSVI